MEIKKKGSNRHRPRDGDNAFRQDTRKAKQTETKESQKKKYQKGHSSGQSDQKQKSEEIKSAADCNFAKENNDFSQENSEEQSGKQEGDDYRHRDTYHRQDKKGRYRRRISRGKRQEKNAGDIHDFQTGDSAFKENGAFGGDMEKKFSNRKNPEKAGAAPPKKKEYYFERVFDEKTGKAGYVLTAVEKEKAFKPDSHMKKAAGRIGAESANFAHGKVAEVEKENSAVEGAHKTEQKAEDILRLAKYRQKNRVQKQHKKAAQPEKMHFRKEISFRNQKFLEEKPQIQQKTLHNQLQKQQQKERIKREYRIAKQKTSSSKAAEHALEKGKNATVTAARKLQEMARRNMGVIAAVGVMAVLSIMIMASVSSCGAMFTDTQATVLASSYLSEPKEIDAADLQMTQLELDLQKKIDAVETDYPDYDEYTYNLGEIGHMPFTLISYLSAVHTEFVASEVESEIQTLFDEMYTLTLTPDTETRTGTRTVTDPDTGEQKEEEYEYTVSILRVKLTVMPLESLVAGKMDTEQADIYATYNETGGLLQVFDSPLALYWYNYVSCHYGYRKNPITGNDEFHRGVDIAVPTGTTVYAAHDGTVTTAAYDSHYGNYVVIEKDGYISKYAHMNSLSVSAGQEITKGTVIGTTGNTGSSTGSHLHIECLYDGEYYNPLFYFEAGEGTLYGEAPGGGGVPGNAVPPDSYDDDTVRALMEEAAKYLGYPYVWGGSKPSTSFDCSGYVCWVFTNSGVHSLPRTTAQGIYNKCTPVSSADAKAGDLIFFTGTYNSGSAVSHVGIYCGNGVMIHCGDPIKYSSINTPYWQSHFYGFGRLN
ncbi:MAG: peptidoglycan DD-metalloendopeptidase family protein [Lachnospiraceae bacterium]|nr:peptidoglycan DD-metalloendopeptidase family protein [Lachnospiraceae bacterium]